MSPNRPLIRTAAVTIVTALAAAAPARAERVHRLSLDGGGEVSATPTASGHGVVILDYRLEGLPRGLRFVAQLNTDTLRLALEGLRVARGTTLGFEARGEALIAGLLTDAWRDGRLEPGRGFYASYAQAATWLTREAAPHFVVLSAGARRWLFNRTGATDPAFTLPSEAWVGELRAHYTYWALQPDPSLWEPHRLFPRARGLAFGVDVEIDLRSEARPWGARDPSVFAPTDERNPPSTAIWSVRGWLRAGVALGPRLRLQLAEVVLWMRGEDDLVRARVGGMVPYVVPVAGLPWASILAGRLAAVELSLHGSLLRRGARDLELGLLVDGAVVDDARRTGAPFAPAGLVGVGAFADLRLGAWQLDLRAGYSPTVIGGSEAARHAFSALAFVGWSWSRSRK